MSVSQHSSTSRASSTDPRVPTRQNRSQRGNELRQDYFNFYPSHLILVLSNFLPAVREGGPAFLRARQAEMLRTSIKISPPPKSRSRAAGNANQSLTHAQTKALIAALRSSFDW